MIEGTPAKLVTLISMISVNKFRGAYSSKYMPDPIPNGTAATAVTSITKVVPTQADRIPADSGRRDGNDVKNSQDKRGKPSISICANKAIKVIIAIINAIM